MLWGDRAQLSDRSLHTRALGGAVHSPGHADVSLLTTPTASDLLVTLVALKSEVSSVLGVG